MTRRCSTLLDAVRARLAAGDVEEEEAGHLLGLLAHWGPAARSAVEALRNEAAMGRADGRDAAVVVLRKLTGDS